MKMRNSVERRGRRSEGDVARERLLAGIPVMERRLELAGVSTAVLEGGEGPPVVLLHGPGEFAAKWLRVIPDLVTTHRVIAPDLPGHGTSEVIDGPLDADRVLTWLSELIEHTCTSPPALVGHVLGGAIAARFAIDYSDRLDRLVLVDTLGLGRFRPAPRFALTMIGSSPDRPRAPTIALCASVRMISTACARRWANAGNRSRRTTSTEPAPRASRSPRAA